MSFLKLAELGNHSRWRYLIGALLIIILSPIVTTFFVVPVTIMMESANPTLKLIEDALIANLAFIVLLGMVYLTVKLLHERDFITLITPRGKIDWRRFLTGYVVYFCLSLIGFIAYVLLGVQELSLNFDLTTFLVFLPILLFLTPIQCCTEEVLLRGYVMQGASRFYLNVIFAAVASAGLFTLMHLANPEVAEHPIVMPVLYFIIAIFFSIITLRDNRLELAMGAHTANNMFAFTFITYESAVIKSPAIFTTDAPNFQAAVFSTIIICGLFYWIVFHWLDKREAAT